MMNWEPPRESELYRGWLRRDMERSALQITLTNAVNKLPTSELHALSDWLTSRRPEEQWWAEQMATLEKEGGR